MPEGKELRKFCTKLSLTEKEVQEWFTRKRATDSKAKDENPKKKPKVAAGSNPKVATVPGVFRISLRHIFALNCRASSGPKIGANIPKKAFASKPSAANLAAAAKAVEDLFGPFHFANHLSCRLPKAGVISMVMLQVLKAYLPRKAARAPAMSRP